MRFSCSALQDGSAEALCDAEQFVDTMRAGVPLANGPEAAADQTRAELTVVLERRERARHLRAVALHQKVTANSEQAFAIVPGCGHERNPASQRLENADGGNPGKPLRVEAAGNVDCRHVLREHGG